MRTCYLTLVILNQDYFNMAVEAYAHLTWAETKTGFWCFNSNCNGTLCLLMNIKTMIFIE